MVGTPAAQHGNVIEISSGPIGIDEACSGIRSLQATLMLSLFFGELYRLTWRRRVLCVLAGFALAFLFNLGRTLLLVSVASAQGLPGMARWHDPAGITILLACFVGLWLLALALKDKNPQCSEASSPSPGGEGRGEGAGLPIFLLASFLVIEAGTQLWFRSHEHQTSTHANWSIQFPSQSAYTTVPMPKAISGQFRYDTGFQGNWRDPNGAQWQLYYFRWFPSRSLNKRVAIHLAKTHGPEKCLPAIGMTLKADLGTISVSPSPGGEGRGEGEPFPAASLSGSKSKIENRKSKIEREGRGEGEPSLSVVQGFSLSFRHYLFEAEGRQLHVFYGIYEDQTGSDVLANRRIGTANRIRAALAGSRNYGQRFLEIAVSGYTDPDAARAALTRELEKLIQVQK